MTRTHQELADGVLESYSRYTVTEHSGLGGIEIQVPPFPGPDLETLRQIVRQATPAGIATRVTADLPWWSNRFKPKKWIEKQWWSGNEVL